MAKKSKDVRGSGVISAWSGRGSVLLVVLMGASLAVAQLDTGTISGTVTDQSGGAVPGAAITIRNVATGITRSLVTNAAGRYEAAALPVGSYEVRASLAGFQTLVRSGITLTVGRNAVVDLALQVGEVAQAITVAGEASFVETTTATVSNLVDEKRVSEIPLNNRDLTQLAFLQPGVLKMSINTDTADVSVAGGGDKFSVAGARGTQNVYLLDGVSNSDVSGNAQSVAGAYEGAETVQEFQVITNNYSAEYPSRPGAIVSAVTKSGTNSFHGSLYEFLRNDNLDAAKWEDNAFGGEKPEFKRNHLGGSLGGPILRDKTFFFTSYEGLRERQTRTGTVVIPTAAGRTGDLGPAGAINPATGTRIWPVHPAVVPYLNLYPLPGQGNTVVQDRRDGTVEIAGTRRRPVNDDFGTVKMDHQFASPRKGFLAATYSTNAATVSNYEVLAAGWSKGVESRKHVISARHTSILSATALNEFGFGFTHAKTPTDIPLTDIDWKNFNGVDLRFRKDSTTEFMGWLNPGLNPGAAAAIANIGLGGNAQFKSQDVFTFKESMSLTRPNHTIKFGTEIQRFHIGSEDESDSRNGSYEFAAFELFLQNRPQIFDVVQPKGAVLLGLPLLGDALYELRLTQFGFYFQDNWKVLPSLTLNLGLRYEFQTTLSETRGHLSSFQDFFGSQVTVNGEYFKNPTRKNFSPRFGFAWSPGDRKTSLRGGFGIYFVPPNVPEYQFHLSTMLPFAAEGGLLDNNSTGAIRFPDAYATQLAQLASAPNYRIVEYDPKPTYVYRWSLTLDREIGNWFLSAGYTGSRALHLSVVSEGNMNRWIGWPANVPTSEKRFPATGGVPINSVMNRLTVNHYAGNSYYQGLAVNLMRRLAAGLQFQVAYTYSKNIDNGSTPGNNTEGLAQGQRGAYYWDMDHRTGLSGQDIRNNLVSNVTYEFPRTALTGFGGAVLNGWQINGIITLSDGPAFEARDTNRFQTAALRIADGLRVNLIPGGNKNPVLGTPSAGQERYYDVSQFAPSVCFGAGLCQVGSPDYQVGRFGNLGRNTLIGPGVATIDFSLNKSFQLTEENRLQFRAEFFNLFNRPNFSIPPANPFQLSGTTLRVNPNVGKIRTTRTSARQIQFGLRFTF